VKKFAIATMVGLLHAATACSLGVDVGEKQVGQTPTLNADAGNSPDRGDGAEGQGEGTGGRGSIGASGADQGQGEASGGTGSVGSFGGTGEGGQTEGIGGSAVFDPVGGANQALGGFDCADGSLTLSPPQDLCNQVVECPDGSDETSALCSEIQFACPDGTWLLHAKRCDGTVDCSTGEDEICEEAAFRCNDGQFIGGKQRCDGDADCFDGSDELDC